MTTELQQAQEFTKDLSVYTAEDAALDAEIERVAATKETMEPISDDGPVVEMKKVKEHLELLRSHVENYKPAATIRELEEQVHIATGEGCDSIEATDQVIKGLFRADFDHIKNETGYGIYKNIRIYLDGHFEKHKNADKLTMEQKLFGQKTK